MKNMTINNIAVACHGKLKNCVNPEDKITSVIIDSRKAAPGNLFIATRGEKVDGHSFISAAVEKGVSAVVCEDEPDSVSVPYILVEDSLKALKDIAIFYRRQINIPVIGITGSVGKTSTKEFIAAVLKTRYNVLSTPGNKNNEIGLPLTMLEIRADHEVAVLEMGINDFGEMHRLSEMARPDIAVITNIGDCHLERLGDRAGVLKAKTEIFDFLSADGHVVVNGDDALLTVLPAVNGKAPILFGIGAENDIVAERVENLGLDGTAAKVSCKKTKKNFEIRISLPGEHMIYSALAAVAVGNLLGLNEMELRAGFKNLKSVPGRSFIMRLPMGTIIDDCYNANPISMGSALRLLKRVKGRKVAILGDMFELGAEKHKLHGLIGTEAVLAGADVLICIGTLSKYMYDAAMLAEGSECKIFYFADKESFLQAAADLLNAHDTVLIKASRGMAFETLVDAIKKMAVFQ